MTTKGVNRQPWLIARWSAVITTLRADGHSAADDRVGDGGLAKIRRYRHPGADDRLRSIAGRRRAMQNRRAAYAMSSVAAPWPRAAFTTRGGLSRDRIDPMLLDHFLADLHEAETGRGQPDASHQAHRGKSGLRLTTSRSVNSDSRQSGSSGDSVDYKPRPNLNDPGARPSTAGETCPLLGCVQR